MWGLLASFSGELFDSQALENADYPGREDEFLALLSEHIRAQTDVSPLRLLARVAHHESVTVETARAIFSAYDKFLAALSDRDKRGHLDKEVGLDNAATDPVYDELRQASQAFRRGINDMFFDQHPTLQRRIRDYGVF